MGRRSLKDLARIAFFGPIASALILQKELEIYARDLTIEDLTRTNAQLAERTKKMYLWVEHRLPRKMLRRWRSKFGSPTM